VQGLTRAGCQPIDGYVIVKSSLKQPIPAANSTQADGSVRESPYNTGDSCHVQCNPSENRLASSQTAFAAGRSFDNIINTSGYESTSRDPQQLGPLEL
jgi:hypothetical protein